jgi:type IV pilus assembly protein PilA
MQNNQAPCRQRQGFTLAEILIVLAIIAVLVGVSIPIFTTQIKKSQIATNQANIRAAKAAVTANYIEYEAGKYAAYIYDIKSGKLVTLGTNTFGTTTTYIPYIDTNNKVCAVTENYDAAKTVANTGKKRLENGNTYTIYAYIAVAVNNDGTMTTCPYYNESTNEIVNAYK